MIDGKLPERFINPRDAEKALNRPLTAKQKRFVEVYAGNATEAAKIVGISKLYAHELLNSTRYLNVQEALRQRARGERQALKRHIIASREERQEFWTLVMRGKIKDYTVVQTKDGPQVLKVPASLKIRVKAAELLGKSEGDFVQRHEIGFDGELVGKILEHFPVDKARELKEKILAKADIIEIRPTRRIEG